MAEAPKMAKTLIGKNEDGTPHFRYVFDGPEGGGVIRTGPIAATVALKDGTVYDLSEDFVAHLPGHAGPIMHHIERLHQRSGLLGPSYVHVCSDECGSERDPEPGSVQAGVVGDV